MFNPQHKVTSLNYSDIEANKGGVKAAIKQSPKKSSFSKENIITKLVVEQWLKNVMIAVKLRT
jgi:hypothetical protein